MLLVRERVGGDTSALQPNEKLRHVTIIVLSVISCCASLYLLIKQYIALKQRFKRAMPQLVHSLKPSAIKGRLLSTPTITEALLRPINVPSPMRSINWIGKWIIVSMCNHCIDKLIFRLDPKANYLNPKATVPTGLPTS